ncbi:MAG: enoyl-CoA hydratase/isomerase family protein [Acidimicrobiales bacterium]
MSQAESYETLRLRHDDRVAWVTLNRPEVHNAFDSTMRRELRDVWRRLRSDDDVRVVVLTGAGDAAFCTGIDRNEAMGSDRAAATATAAADHDDEAARAAAVGHVGGPFQFDDVGDFICPKQCDLWKPVVAAVNGMACGGAFYLLGECDVIIAADHATFFDPHVTYGMAAVFEPVHLLQKVPLGEILRLSLLGASERMTAERAHQIGLVSEVAPRAELTERAAWCARTIAESPPLAVQTTLRAIWTAHELARREALALAPGFVALGTDAASIRQGQERFASGGRVDWRSR